MWLSHVRIGVAIALLAFLLRPAQASAGEEFDPPLGVYHYLLEWAGSEVARADLRVSREGEVYRIEAVAETGGVARWLRLRYRGEAKIDAEDRSAIEAVIERDRDGRVRETRMFFGTDGVRVEESRRGGDKPPKKKVRDIEAGSAALDPVSFLFMARGVDWEVGVADRFEVLSGEDRWMVDLNCIDRVPLEIAGVRREAWVVIPTLEEIGEDGEESGKPFVREIALFLSADAAREILKIRTRTRVGIVRLRLERFSREPVGKD